MQLAVELLAGDLGGEQALAGVGHLVFGIVPRAFGHQRGQVRLQFGHAVAGQGGDEEHLVEIGLAGELLGQLEQRFLGAGVDLVEHQQLALGPVLQRFEQRLEFVAALLDRASTTSRIASASCAPSQAALTIARSSRRLRREDARRVGQDDLGFALPARCPAAGRGWSAPWRETIATFWPTSALTSVDLPALGAPITATRPQRCAFDHANVAP